MDTLYPAFLSSVLDGFHEERSRYVEYCASLRESCAAAQAKVNKSLGKMMSLSLSAGEKARLKALEAIAAEGTRCLGEDGQWLDQEANVASLPVFRDALDLFNKALLKLEETRLAYIARREKEERQKEEMERLRQEAQLRDECSTAHKKADKTLAELKNKDLSKAEAARLSNAKKLVADGSSVRDQVDKAQNPAATGDSSAVLQKALDLFNAAL